MIPTLLRLWARNSQTPSLTLITASWIEEPDRILHRVSTNGGSDGSFLADVLRLVESYKEEQCKKEELEYRAHWVFSSEMEETLPPSLSKAASLSSGGSDPETETYEYTYEFYSNRGELQVSPNYPDKNWESILSSMMQAVLQGYGREGAGKWKTTLHENAEAVCRYMLWYDNVVTGRRSVPVNSPRVRLLELDRSCRLWSVSGLRLERAPIFGLRRTRG